MTVLHRTMTKADLGVALSWAADEGWNPGVEDAEPFYAADPEGFFVAELNGQPVAAISVVNHTDALAFLGLYICRPEHRGQGIGLGLWTHAVRHAGSRTIGLDGVPDQQANYEASGFRHAGQTQRFEGRIGGDRHSDIRLATPSDIPHLSALEATATGYAKNRLNAAWLAQADTRQTLCLGERAFATWRKCQGRSKIGPLVAPDLDTATVLILHIAALAPDGIVIDLPQHMGPLAKWCEDRGLTVSFGTARMYKGKAPQPGRDLFAVSTLELG